MFSSKQTCPHCSKSFVNVALHITKVHDSWIAERKTEKALVWDHTKKMKVWGERTTGWELSKNGEVVCLLTNPQGTTSYHGEETTYSDWHGREDCKYILLCDYVGAHAKTKIIYSHYKGGTVGLGGNIVCDNLTVIG